MNDDRLIALLNSNDLKNEVEKLTPEERHFIIESDNFLCGLLIDTLYEHKITLFDEEESLKLYKARPRLFLNYSLEHSKIYILNLPIDFIISEFIEKGYGLNYNHLIKEPQKYLHKLLKADKDIVLDSLFEDFSDEELVSLMKNPIIAKKYCLYYHLKSDKYIIKYLHLVPNYSRTHVICELKDDNNKIKLLKIFTPDKGRIISSIKDDEIKEQLFHKFILYLSERDKGMIVGSIQNPEIIKRLTSHLKTNDATYHFVITKRREDNNIPDETYRELILSIKNERNLLNLLFHSPFIDDYDFTCKIINRLTKPELLFSALKELDERYSDAICKRLGPKNIARFVKENRNWLNHYKMLQYLPDNILFKNLEHITFRNAKYDNSYLPLLQKIANKYHLNLEHLVKLTSQFGLAIIEQIQNKNIINAINLDEENFNKYLKVVDSKNFTQDRTKVSSILYSLLNKRFSLKNPNSVQIFSRTLQALTDGNIELVNSLIAEVLSKVDLSHFNITTEELIKGIFNKDSEIITKYNLITHEYLVNIRNKFVNDAMEDGLQSCMKCYYEENAYINYLLKVLPSEKIIESVENSLYPLYKSNIIFLKQNPNIKDLLNNKELLKSLIEFKKRPTKEAASVLKPYLKDFNELLKYLFNERSINSFNYKLYGVPIVYEIPELNNEYLIEVISNIDPIKLKDLVFQDSNIFQEMLKYLDTYCVLNWESFQKISKSADVEMIPSTSGSLINNFAYIYKQMLDAKKDSKIFTFTSALATAEALDSDADIYSCLFGRENYSYIRRNPAPNASSMSKQQRLNRALECLKIMHDRKYIPVPPVDKNFSLSSKKTLNILIGNTNDPINLTYGERTGACMRIGGAGSSLFDFCLKNDNGFHISFNDPNTGALVSRVSCFVNGNTLFLNQVRNSLSNEYSNDDIKEATKLIGKEIIEQTKNSKNPIQNVITSPCYAFSGELTINTHCNYPTKGYIPIPYTDITADSCVVASVDNPMVPIKLNPLKVDKYEVSRSRIYQVESEKAGHAIAHIETLDSYLSGVPIDDIEIPNRPVKMAIYGEDWYVAITTEDKIIDYISKTSRNINKAKEEHDQAMRKLKSEIKKGQVANQYAMQNQEELNLEPETRGKGK